MFTLEIDKKGLVYALELCAVAVVIAVSAEVAAREIVAWYASVVPEDISFSDPAIIPDENSFYVDPPVGVPLFLSAAELEKKREALMWEGRDFLLVDLDQRAITRYENGAAQSAFPILAAAGAERFFEVPQGLYTVQGKTERHFSQRLRRYFPWAVYLYGNYLIHADTGAATGGIQVVASHARDLHAHATDGMPVLVFRQDSPADIAFTYVRKNNLPHRVPEVTSAAALAADLETGEILFEKNVRDVYPTASLTKLMTAVVAMEDIAPDTILTVTDDAVRTYGDSGGLARGETFRSADLLRGLILPSSNDAAAVYANALPDFLQRLNTKAQSIGMARTFFEDPSGLSGRNVTSAENLFTLLRYINERHPDLLALSREPVATQASENKKKQHVWSNINWPRGDTRYIGGKAGFTDDSLQTMAGVWSVRVAEYGGRKIAVILLGSRNRIQDVRAVITYLEQDFIYGFAFSSDIHKPQAAAH